MIISPRRVAHKSNFDTLLLFVTESGFDPSDLATSRTWVLSGGSGVGLLCSSARAVTRDPPTKLDSESSVSSHRMRIPDLL